MPKLLKKKSAWFDYLDGRVEVVHLDDRDVLEISDKTVTVVDVFDAATGTLQRERRAKNLLDRQLTVRRAVKAWENFQDADGNEMACTDENKDLWACDADFMAWLNKRRDDLAKIVAEERARAEGN